MIFIMLLFSSGRPWGLVRSKVRKDYPGVQLTAWKVCGNRYSNLRYVLDTNIDPIRACWCFMTCSFGL